MNLCVIINGYFVCDILSYNLEHFIDICNIQGNYGDVTARKELRKRLKCHSFDWYVKNVYPDLFVPGDALFLGEVSTPSSSIRVFHPFLETTPYLSRSKWLGHAEGASTRFMVASGGVLSKGYGDDGPGVCLGDGQTEAEGVPSQGGRGDALLPRMPPYLTV